MGGELPALCLIEAVTRLLPGALGDEDSHAQDSFQTGLLDYPEYTRPPQFRGLTVPEVLLSGHHGKVEAWRRREALRRTLARRPDLLDGAPLTEADHRALAELRDELTSAQTAAAANSDPCRCFHLPERSTSGERTRPAVFLSDDARSVSRVTAQPVRSK